MADRPKEKGKGDAPLDDAEQIVDAIRSGCVDAFVVQEQEGEAVYTLETADLPYSALVQRMQQGAAMLDSKGDVIYCNPSLAALLGVALEKVIGVPIQSLIEPEDRAACRHLLSELQMSSREEEFHLRRADRTVIPARFSFTPLSRDKSVTGVLITDLTAEKSYAELTSRIQTLQDEERRGIARELHDSVGQLLVAISMNLARFRKESSLSPALAGLINDSAQMVDQVSKEIRTISHLLHPPLLDVAGLSSAIRWYVDGFSERSQIQVHLEIPSDIGRLPSDVEITMFRIVQECLTNVYRHSGSDSCSISMRHDPGRLQIEIRDNGRGIASLKKGSERSVPGLGFRGMQERLRQLGGTLEIDSSENGTTVTAILPLSPQRSTEESERSEAI